MKLGHLFRFTMRTIAAVALGPMLYGWLVAQENAGETKPIPLKAGMSAGFALAPGEAQKVTVALAGGEALTAGFEQTAGAISVTESCAGCASQEPRTNPAGVHSSISITAIGVDAGATSFAVQNPSKTRAA